MTDNLVIDFENIGTCFYERVGIRAPKKGEYYICGQSQGAVIATVAFTSVSKRLIVRPTHRAVRQPPWARGEAIPAE